MTDKVLPSVDRPYSAKIEGGIHDVGTTTWVIPDGNREIDDPDGDLSSGTLGGYTIDSQTSSGDEVTFSGGEAFVRGRWVARDTTTTVTGLSPSDGDELVVGFDPDSSDTVEIGKPTNVSSDYTAVLAEYDSSGIAAWDGTVRSTTPREETVEPKTHASQHDPDTGDDALSGYPKATDDKVLATGKNTGISVGAASSDSTDTVASTTVTVTLSPTPSGTVEEAVAQIKDAGTLGLGAQVTGLSTTSVDVTVFNQTTSSATVDVHVIAVAPR